MFEMVVHEPILVYSMLYNTAVILCFICPAMVDTRCIKPTDTVFRDLADGRFQVTLILIVILYLIKLSLFFESNLILPSSNENMYRRLMSQQRS